jgi:hypothetical protein
LAFEETIGCEQRPVIAAISPLEEKKHAASNY